jgi:disease resistance protein RPM1
MDSHPESTIIITTRIVDVATKAGGVYRMKPLSDANSKLLLYTKICGGEGVTPDNQHHEATDKILNKCAGVPLAIITIASLLVGKQSADWSKVYDAIGFGNEDNEVIQNTRKILSFSYYDLPSDLKACLLYLGMFPEDHFIRKKPLIWRWIIEGFVPDKEGMGSYEHGEICFNMLVNKSMIRWISPKDINGKYEGGGAGGGCRVHDMVLELISTMSRELNFVTVHDMKQQGICSRGKQNGRVRRLALHGSSTEHNTIIAKGHVI